MPDNSEVEDFLSHYGKKGMKWGVRKLEKTAAKDAKESAQAKMYFGEGAGVRRRLINNSVKSKSKDPAYKAAFEKHLANQDLTKAGNKARSKRKRTDVANTTKKTAKGVGHVLNGNSQYASYAVVAAVGAAAAARKTGMDRKVYEKGKSFVKSAQMTYKLRDLNRQMKNFKG